MPVEDINEPDICVFFTLETWDKDVCLNDSAKNHDSCTFENSLSELFLYKHHEGLKIILIA